MYIDEDRLQREFDAFDLVFAGALDRDNRWVKMAGMIPWDRLEPTYKHHFSHKGRPAKRFRVALGTLIIQEILKLSDRDTVQAIRENVYLQFFLGFPAFRKNSPFDPSLITIFRKRLNWKNVAAINDVIASLQPIPTTTQENETDHKTDDDTDGDSPQDGEPTPPESPGNQGTIIVDATCTPADIRHPHDLTLLDEARRVSERLIDTLSKVTGVPKPRTYRKKARRAFLLAIKNRKRTPAETRRAIRNQLGYLKRNLTALERLTKRQDSPVFDTNSPLRALSRSQYKSLLVIHEVYRQQEAMHRQRSHSTEHRIVSIQQPHVRPIVRGKARSNVEFGAKVSLCVSKGLAFVDKLSFDAYSESGDVILHAENYRKRTGYYPQTILADKAYQSRANKLWCQERNIRLMGKLLGRPYEEDVIKKALSKMHRNDERERVVVEGKIGVQKRRYRWSKIMGKRMDTSYTMIMVSVLAANLTFLLRRGIFILVSVAKYWLALIRLFDAWLWPSPNFAQNAG
jgi:transposase, IS5 family